MIKKNLDEIETPACFQHALEDPELTLKAADLLRLKAQINLCAEMAKATRQWADSCEKKPVLIDTTEKRLKITQYLTLQFWQAVDHPSIKALAQELTDDGFQISRVLLSNYVEGKNIPNKNRLIPFMRAMAKIGENSANRLRTKLVSNKDQRLSASITDWMP